MTTGPDADTGQVLIKVPVVAATWGSAMLIFVLARRLVPQLRWTAVTGWLWSPISLVEFGGDGHIDGVVVFFVLLACYAGVRGWGYLATVALGLAVAVKYLPAVFAPPLLAMVWRRAESRTGVVVRIACGVSRCGAPCARVRPVLGRRADVRRRSRVRATVFVVEPVGAAADPGPRRSRRSCGRADHPGTAGFGPDRHRAARLHPRGGSPSDAPRCRGDRGCQLRSPTWRLALVRRPATRPRAVPSHVRCPDPGDRAHRDDPQRRRLRCSSDGWASPVCRNSDLDGLVGVTIPGLCCVIVAIVLWWREPALRSHRDAPHPCRQSRQVPCTTRRSRSASNP